MEDGVTIFEETIRTLRQFDGTTGVSVPIPDDEEGYFDRECPSEEIPSEMNPLRSQFLEESSFRRPEVFRNAASSRRRRLHSCNRILSRHCDLQSPS